MKRLGSLLSQVFYFKWQFMRVPENRSKNSEFKQTTKKLEELGHDAWHNKKRVQELKKES